jgi:hypothetical protein
MLEDVQKSALYLQKVEVDVVCRCRHEQLVKRDIAYIDHPSQSSTSFGSFNQRKVAIGKGYGKFMVSLSMVP